MIRYLKTGDKTSWKVVAVLTFAVFIINTQTCEVAVVSAYVGTAPVSLPNQSAMPHSNAKRINRAQLFRSQQKQIDRVTWDSIGACSYDQGFNQHRNTETLQASLTTNMFLPPSTSRSQTMHIPPSHTFGNNDIRSRVIPNPHSPVLDKSRTRYRGVLGFALQDDIEPGKTKKTLTSIPPFSTTKLFSSKSHSQLPSSDHQNQNEIHSSDPKIAWNNYSPSDVFPNPILNRSPTSPLSFSQASFLDAATDSKVPLLWLPWIPTKEQIDSLNIAELKQVCSERGLLQTGNKVDLQKRLWKWSLHETQQQLRRQRLVIGNSDFASSVGQRQRQVVRQRQERANFSKKSVQSTTGKQLDNKDKSSKSGAMDTALSGEQQLKANSLGEWARTVDIQPLLKRRERIHKEKREGKKIEKGKRLGKGRKEAPQKTSQQVRSELKKVFEASSSVTYSNYEVKQLYAHAKHADQLGDRKLCKQILFKLKEITPTDGRLYRRLSRMFSEEGDTNKARLMLQEGIRVDPENSFLWHGLGQLELKHDNNYEEARSCFQKAIQCDPSQPHPYHAWGTLEHKQGRIAAAMKTLKQGLEYCPTNHRLHHALGDLYREAKMLDMAEKAYKRALEHGSGDVNYCFAYSALANVAYEQGKIDDCRKWLKQAVSVNDGRHAQGWIALAQLEQSEGNIESARAIYVAALTQYERGLIARNVHYWKKNSKFTNKRNDYTQTYDDSKDQLKILMNSIHQEEDPTVLKRKLLQSVPRYRSGDHFLKVYLNWARLEMQYGSQQNVDEVFSRASEGFPFNWKLTLDWAQYHAKIRHNDRARALFDEACRKAGSRHANPHRFYAEFEMSYGNYDEARKILYRGAVEMMHTRDGSRSNIGQSTASSDLVKLFHTWAICEWACNNLQRAEVLFDHALRLTDAGEEGLKLRSFLLYSIAKLEYYMDEYYLAQHFIALCLKENRMPGGNAKVWELWLDVAEKIGNDELVEECSKQMEETLKENDKGDKKALLSLMQGPDMQPLMNRTPWHHKVLASTASSIGRRNKSISLPSDQFFDRVKFPKRWG